VRCRWAADNPVDLMSECLEDTPWGVREPASAISTTIIFVSVAQAPHPRRDLGWVTSNPISPVASQISQVVAAVSAT